MNSAWDRAKKMADQHQNAGGIFIRLQNDGDKVVGAFIGEPHAREVHWIENKYEECTNKGCVHCAGGSKPHFRVMMNFFVTSEGTMKIIEGGTMFFGAVLTVREKYGLDKWLFEIKRVGKPKDPKTTYTVLPEERIEGAIAAKLAAAQPHDLFEIGKSRDDGAADPAAAKPASPGHVDMQTATELHELLKQLPRSEVDGFFAAFNIGRVRDLSAQSAADARAYLTKKLAPQENDFF